MADEITFQNDPVDPSLEFRKQHNHFFVAQRTERVEPDRAAGEVMWKRMSLAQRVSYHQVTLQLEDYAVWRDIPEHEYADERACPFELQFVSPRCVRLRLAIRPTRLGDGDSIILDGYEPGEAWEREDDRKRSTWRSEHGSISIRRDPFGIELRDAAGRIMTRTLHVGESRGVVNVNPMPLCFVRSSSSFHRHVAAGLGLSPGERLYGCGESFTRLDKRGQLLHMWTRDAYSAQTTTMYKPVPFMLSSRGWAVFAQTAAPATFDLGNGHDGAAVLYLADDVADLFLFLGEPKEVVSEYTALTGRSSMPPRWSFGLWIEFPGDPGSWLVEDQYLFGTDLLVAPLFKDASERRVYLPPGRWHRFAEDEGVALDGPGWHTLAVQDVPAAVLVRDGAAVRLAEPAKHTGELDWDGARAWRPAG
jgi:alpha-D-xyloside xylohydrolase